MFNDDLYTIRFFRIVSVYNYQLGFRVTDNSNKILCYFQTACLVIHIFVSLNPTVLPSGVAIRVFIDIPRNFFPVQCGWDLRVDDSQYSDVQSDCSSNFSFINCSKTMADSHNDDLTLIDASNLISGFCDASFTNSPLRAVFYGDVVDEEVNATHGSSPVMIL
jgi:hypothetical protein